MEGQITNSAIEIATPSGKNRSTENFPVGSLLIRKDLRAHIHAYYRFARMGDDIADNPNLLSQEKVDRLNAMEEVLKSDGDERIPIAADMRRSLAATKVSPVHCSDLLVAFRMDAVKQRYENWQELMHYCNYSASPVGRYLLDLHGEARSSWQASDALCNALQVINHLQDCKDDAREMNRVYIPLDYLQEEDVKVSALLQTEASPALRKVLDRLLDDTAALLQVADRLPGQVTDFRMRAESAIIVDLAHRLVRALRKGDPLTRKIKLGKGSIFCAAITGLGRAMLGRS